MALLPKFSIRQMLFFMIGFGVVSACMAGAARGDVIGFGLSVAIVALVVPAIVFSLAYWLLYFVAVGSEAISRPGQSKEIVLAQVTTGFSNHSLIDETRQAADSDCETKANQIGRVSIEGARRDLE